MGFFESFPPPPPPVPPPAPSLWFRPPPLVFGGFVPQRLVLLDSPAALLVIDRLLAFPGGLEFTTVVVRRSDPDDLSNPFEWDHRRRDTPRPPPEVLRLGIAFSDGRVASNLLDIPRGTEAPRRPVLQMFSGHGGRGHWELRWWLWPLPPPGAVRFVVEWPAEAVPETSAEIDGEEIRASAETALVLRDG